MFLIAAVQLVTLAQAIAIAAARSPALQIAADTYRLSRANVDLSKTAYQPNVEGTASAIHGSSNPAAEAPSENQASVAVTQLVYDGGHVLAQIRAAQASEAAGAGTLTRSAQQLAYTVGATYYSALEARAAVRLTLRIVAQDRAQEDLIRAQIAAGIASHVDLATAQIPTAQALVAVARAQGQEVAALAAFDNAMGLHADSAVEPFDDATAEAAGSLVAYEPVDYDAALARARAERPDYQSAQHAVVAASDTLRAARTLAAPQVSLVAQAGAPANNYVGATMTLPLYDQGAKNAQTELAAIQLDLETATLSQTELGVELDVRQAFGILDGAREAVIQSEAELKTAQEVLIDTQVQYRAGITNLALLLNAQSGLTQAETDRLNAVFALRQAEQSYLYALGDVALPST
jgi:outer membrane protein TolC